MQDFFDVDLGPGAFSISEQIACIERELRFRERCYPRWVSEQKMAQATAEREIACMKQVSRTLRALVNDGK